MLNKADGSQVNQGIGLLLVNLCGDSGLVEQIRLQADHFIACKLRSTLKEQTGKARQASHEYLHQNEDPVWFLRRSASTMI